MEFLCFTDVFLLLHLWMNICYKLFTLLYRCFMDGLLLLKSKSTVLWMCLCFCFFFTASRDAFILCLLLLYNAILEFRDFKKNKNQLGRADPIQSRAQIRNGLAKARYPLTRARARAGPVHSSLARFTPPMYGVAREHESLDMYEKCTCIILSMYMLFNSYSTCQTIYNLFKAYVLKKDMDPMTPAQPDRPNLFDWLRHHLLELWAYTTKSKKDPLKVGLSLVIKIQSE